MEAATQEQIETGPAGEYVFITPRGGGLPYFVRDPQATGGKPDSLVRGELVDERGRTLNSRFEIQRKEMLKCHRAIRHPSGVLVPV